jgi:hypothetical protein
MRPIWSICPPAILGLPSGPGPPGGVNPAVNWVTVPVSAPAPGAGAWRTVPVPSAAVRATTVRSGVFMWVLPER